MLLKRLQIIGCRQVHTYAHRNGHSHSDLTLNGLLRLAGVYVFY
jgi:hypothetical protein